MTLFEKLPELIAAVESEQVSVGIENELLLTAQLKDNQHPKLKTVQTYPALFTTRLAFAVLKADLELLSMINASLAKVQADGTLKLLGAKWGVNIN